MASRRKKPLPSYEINGWDVQKQPNTFAEEYIYVARAFNEAGYQTGKKGFQRLRDARDFCQSNPPPQHRYA